MRPRRGTVGKIFFFFFGERSRGEFSERFRSLVRGESGESGPPEGFRMARPLAGIGLGSIVRAGWLLPYPKPSRWP